MSLFNQFCENELENYRNIRLISENFENYSILFNRVLSSAGGKLERAQAHVLRGQLVYEAVLLLQRQQSKVEGWANAHNVRFPLLAAVHEELETYVVPMFALAQLSNYPTLKGSFSAV